jgi:hypothetical protein
VAAETRLSAFRRRAAVLAAALASIATSQARWRLDATLPLGTAPVGKGKLVTVEASREPSVGRRPHGGGSVLTTLREGASPWSTSGVYYLPAGFELSGVSISGHDCATGSGGFCSPCEPPAGSFVRVVNVEPVEPWSLSGTFAEQSALTEASPVSNSFVVEVDASRPVDLEAVATSGDVARVAPSVSRLASADGGRRQRFDVTWYSQGEAKPGPLAVRWVVRAAINGFCKGEGECRAPAGESVEIVSITGR